MPAARCLDCHRPSHVHRPGGPAVIHHTDDCPNRMPGSAVADATELVTGDNPISRPMDVTAEMAAHDPLLPEEHPVTGAYAGRSVVDNRPELVEILTTGFKWKKTSPMGLTQYISPDKATIVVLDDIEDNDVTVVRMSTETTPGWKASMTRTTPTWIMLQVAFGRGAGRDWRRQACPLRLNATNWPQSP